MTSYNQNLQLNYCNTKAELIPCATESILLVNNTALLLHITWDHKTGMDSI